MMRKNRKALANAPTALLLNYNDYSKLKMLKVDFGIKIKKKKQEQKSLVGDQITYLSKIFAEISNPIFRHSLEKWKQAITVISIQQNDRENHYQNI